MEIEHIKFLHLSTTDWIHIIQTEEININTLSCFASHIPDEAWDQIIEHQNLNEKFILDFFYKLNKQTLFKKQRIHEKFISDNIKMFENHMEDICQYQYLSINFLVKYSNIVNWKKSFLYQKHITAYVITKYFNKLNEKKIITNPLEVFHPNIIKNFNNSVKSTINIHNEHIKLINNSKQISSLNRIYNRKNNKH